MFTFKEFIVEVFDKPYPIVHKSDNTYSGGNMSAHRYRIDGDDGHRFHVHISHNKHTGHSDVSFEDDYGHMGMTGKVGHKSGRVISSVAKIVKHHVNNVPTVKSIGFEGAKHIERGSDRSTLQGRNRLYSRITAKAGGTTQDHDLWTVHSIPADKLRAA